MKKPKFKYGDKIKITSEGFYNGASGVVVKYDWMDTRYIVQLSAGGQEWFYEEYLIKEKK